MRKNTNLFFGFQDRSIPDVLRDICPCSCDHQTAYKAYWHLYCVKNEAIYAEIPCFNGAGVMSISVEPRGHVSANRSKVIKSRWRSFLFTCSLSFLQTL